jgi:hypothetical protein
VTLPADCPLPVDVLERRKEERGSKWAGRERRMGDEDIEKK